MCWFCMTALSLVVFQRVVPDYLSHHAGQLLAVVAAVVTAFLSRHVVRGRVAHQYAVPHRRHPEINTAQLKFSQNANMHKKKAVKKNCIQKKYVFEV